MHDRVPDKGVTRPMVGRPRRQPAGILNDPDCTVYLISLNMSRPPTFRIPFAATMFVEGSNTVDEPLLPVVDYMLVVESGIVMNNAQMVSVYLSCRTTAVHFRTQ